MINIDISIAKSTRIEAEEMLKRLFLTRVNDGILLLIICLPMLTATLLGVCISLLGVFYFWARLLVKYSE